NNVLSISSARSKALTASMMK
ncbi:lysogeny establishment protein, partial [Escherichia coli]|nr:lysogeny establishment protein [Escherichia coli]